MIDLKCFAALAIETERIFSSTAVGCIIFSPNSQVWVKYFLGIWSRLVQDAKHVLAYWMFHVLCI